MNHHPFDAIIFDLDGTLIDTETADFEACRILFEENGQSLCMDDWARRIVGIMDGYDSLLEELAHRLGNGSRKEQLWQRLRELWPVTLQNIGLMPGVNHLLPQLAAAGYLLGIATASDRDWANRWLSHFSLTPYFRAVATGDDVPSNKPAPDVYLFAAAQLGVNPNRCLVFEDSAAGTRAASAAGMTVVAVATPLTKNHDFSQAHAVVPGLDRVTPEWVSRVKTGF